jgi:ATP-dependent DNA helicase RecG
MSIISKTAQSQAYSEILFSILRINKQYSPIKTSPIIKLITGINTRPRNPIIADVSFKGGYFDAWGRGTIKILDTCKEAKLPEPEIIEQDGGMLITLFKNIYQETILADYPLNKRQIEALLLWKDDGEIVSGKYKDRFSVTDRTARRDLVEMVNLGILRKEGDKKTTRYLFVR